MNADALRALGIALASFVILGVGAGASAWFGLPHPMGVALVGATVVGLVGTLDGFAAAVRGRPSKSTLAIASLAIVLGLIGASGGLLAALVIILRALFAY
jgi:hypothetical protein